MKVTIQTKGMHCRSCEMLIADSLCDEKGVKSAKANHKDGRVVVEFDEKLTTPEKLKAIIAKEGYEVQ
jgi:copper chaperone CopZ